MSEKQILRCDIRDEAASVCAQNDRVYKVNF